MSRIVDTEMEPLIVGYGLEWANKEDWVLAKVSEWLAEVAPPDPPKKITPAEKVLADIGVRIQSVKFVEAI